MGVPRNRETNRETPVEMTPIQLWLPTVHGGIARPELGRDRHRMFREWGSEHVMWSVPGWTGPRNWLQGSIRVGCLAGESYECVRILHVGDNGTLVGPAAAHFPNDSVNGLLDAWLNSEFVGLSAVDPDGQISIEVPHAVKGGVVYVPAKVKTTFANVLPFTHVGANRTVYAQWPPTADAPSTVSPEMESALAPLATPPEGTLPVQFTWAAPFEDLKPLIGPMDDLYARARMRWIAEMITVNVAGARAQATTEARDWLSEGQSTVERAWLQPIVSEEGKRAALFAIEARFGVEAYSLKDAYANAWLTKQLGQLMPVRRAWGVPGLMWALLLDRLNASQPFRHCNGCGRLISGKADKRFCAEEDNSECYRARKREDKRRSRNSN
jgi:predicted nucleic acid-binding Zn ribbon protein